MPQESCGNSGLISSMVNIWEVDNNNNNLQNHNFVGNLSGFQRWSLWSPGALKSLLWSWQLEAQSPSWLGAWTKALILAKGSPEVKQWSPRAPNVPSWSPGALHFLGQSPGALKIPVHGDSELLFSICHFNSGSSPGEMLESLSQFSWFGYHFGNPAFFPLFLLQIFH